MQRATTVKQDGVVTRTLGDLIYVWPLRADQQKELVFQDMVKLSSYFLKAGDWIQMEVECGDIVVYREKIEPSLPTFVNGRGIVRVKTRLYFPNGLSDCAEAIIGYSDDLGRVGIFFRCPELKPNLSYDVWVSRPRRNQALLEERYNVHWCLVRQTLIPVQDGNMQRPVTSTWEDGGSFEQFNNILTENNPSQEYDYSYALNFSNEVLRKLFNNRSVCDAVRRHNIDFAHSIDTYLRTERNQFSRGN